MKKYCDEIIAVKILRGAENVRHGSENMRHGVKNVGQEKCVA